MQLKLSSRTVDGILVLTCNGRIVFGEESALLRETVKKAIEHAETIAKWLWVVKVHFECWRSSFGR